MAVKDFVDDAINNNTITIFSKSWCPYCKSAKTLLATEFDKTPTKIFELDELDDGTEIQSYLFQKTGQRTVPNVFINQQHIGGNDDLQAAHKAGKLAELVNAKA